MALSQTEIRQLQDLTAADGWRVYLGWLDRQIEETMRELFNLEQSELETFVRLQSRLRTLKDVSYFFELELFNEAAETEEGKKQTKEKLASVVDRYSERFLGIFRRLRRSPVNG